MIDLQLKKLAAQELKRQREGIELIPSENYASSAVRKLLASYFVNKYSEGYPYKRYYGGNEVVDEVETLAQERAKKLFQVVHANVQPYSGSPANLAVYLAICNPGDVIMGQALTAGGHLTHGHHVSATGIFFKSVPYFVKSQVGPKEDLFDFAAIRQLAKKHRPKLIWVGGTAHPLVFNYQKFAQIADEVGAYLAVILPYCWFNCCGCASFASKTCSYYYHYHPQDFTWAQRRNYYGYRQRNNKDPQLPQKIDKAVFPVCKEVRTITKQPR
jgi:glycine hydroxymethyltransferase